jgi:hypothetical protein
MKTIFVILALTIGLSAIGQNIKFRMLIPDSLETKSSSLKGRCFVVIDDDNLRINLSKYTSDTAFIKYSWAVYGSENAYLRGKQAVWMVSPCRRVDTILKASGTHNIWTKTISTLKTGLSKHYNISEANIDQR